MVIDENTLPVSQREYLECHNHFKVVLFDGKGNKAAEENFGDDWQAAEERFQALAGFRYRAPCTVVLANRGGLLRSHSVGEQHAKDQEDDPDRVSEAGEKAPVL